MSKKNRKESILSEYKKLHPKQCVLCGTPANDLCHLLPRSLFPEYITEPNNLVIMCRECHNFFDNNIEFRKQQSKLYEKAKQIDELGANRYFKMNY